MSWQNEPARHSLSARGLCSGRKKIFRGLHSGRKKIFIGMKAKRLVKDYLNKKTIRQLASKYNASISTVWGALQERDINIRHKNKLTSTQKNEIIGEYKKGIGSYVLAKRYGVAKGTILLLLKKAKANLRSPKIKIFSETEEKQIANEYRSGKLQQELAEEKNVTATTIRRTLLIQKTPIRPQPRFKVNEKFFSKVTPKSAYVLGFWTADGYAKKDRQSIQFDQKEKEILEKIKKAMGANYNILPHKLKGEIYYRLAFWGKEKLYNSLQKLCPYPIQAKSFTAEYPNIPAKYDREFIRGLFDGDGSISFDKQKKANLTFSGTKKLLIEIQKRISKIKGIKKGSLYKIKKSRIWALAYSGNPQVKAIGNWFYKEANDLYLDRKKKKFDEIAVTSLQKKVNVTGG